MLATAVRPNIAMANSTGQNGIVTLALVSHFWPLPEPAKSLEMLQRHEAKRSEFGGELCQRNNAERLLTKHSANAYKKLRCLVSSPALQRTGEPVRAANIRMELRLLARHARGAILQDR